jgi:capsular polysaccharide transport system permease protein
MDLFPALTIQRAVIFALFIRELKTRFGTYRLGYFWALLEPLAHIAVVLALIGIRSKRIIPGIDFPVFLITGLVPFFMFRNIVTRLMSAVDANKGLFDYKQVKPMDAMITRLILEGIIYLFVYILLIAAAGLIGYHIKVHNLLGLMAIYAILYLFSFGIGMISCIVCTLYQEPKKFIPIIMHPLYLISAVLFPMSAIPQQYQKWLLWNPLVHTMELARTTYFISFNTKTGDIFYLLAWTISVLMLGLSLYWVKRTEVLASA